MGSILYVYIKKNVIKIHYIIILDKAILYQSYVHALCCRCIFGVGGYRQPTLKDAWNGGYFQRHLRTSVVIREGLLSYDDTTCAVPMEVLWGPHRWDFDPSARARPLSCLGLQEVVMVRGSVAMFGGSQKFSQVESDQQQTWTREGWGDCSKSSHVLVEWCVEVLCGGSGDVVSCWCSCGCLLGTCDLRW